LLDIQQAFYFRSLNFWGVAANFPEDVVDSLPDSMTQGIYYGWAQVRLAASFHLSPLSR
jgi:hypothetical protein